MSIVKQARISHHKVSKLLWCFCVDVDASRTALLVKVNRKTVNRFFAYCRAEIFWHQMKELRKIVGEAEVDESYFGAKRVRGFHGKLKRGRGTKKQPVFGIVKRNGKVYTEIVTNCKKDTLQAIIKGKVDPSAVIYSDGWRGYDG